MGFLRLFKHYYVYLLIIAGFCAIYLSMFYTYTINIGLLKKYTNLLPLSKDTFKYTPDNDDLNRHFIETVTNSTKYQGSSTSKLKYILQWTSPRTVPFQYMGVGQQVFLEKKCPYTNCYVTGNKSYLSDYTQFDVIAFSGPEVREYAKQNLPLRRSPHQKYVFASIESPVHYPVCKEYFDGFFNWTWTYKLDSESKWGYLVVRDAEDKIVGPKASMHWIKHEDMLPVSDDLKKILRGKTKLAAWFVSNCHTPSKREDYVKDLNKVLQSKYDLSVDIYGRCGKLTCSRGNEDECHEMIRKDYLFYLSFENSFSEDYVTEKLAHAVSYNVLPIVYGGANYSRFLPEGSYLNAREFEPEALAAKMYELMNDFDQYTEFFRWTNHYRFHRRAASLETDDYCAMCAILNDEKKVKEVTVYKEFRKWWNVEGHKCYF